MKPWQALWHLIRCHPLLYGVNLLLTIFFYLLPFAPAFVIRELFNTLSGEAQAGVGFWSLVAWLVALAVAEAAMLFPSEAVNVALREAVSAQLRQNTLARILAQPGAQALRETPGEAISYFRDDVKSVEDTISGSTEPLGQVLLAVVGLLVMVWLSPLITLAIVIPMVVVVVWVRLAGARVQRYRAERQAAVGRITDFLGETFHAVQAIKVATAEQPVVDHFRRLNDRREQTAIKDRLLTALLASATWNTVNLGTGLMLLLAGQAMQAGTFTVGDFALFVLFLEWITQSLVFFGGFLTHYEQATVSFQRLGALARASSPAPLVWPAPLSWRGPLPELPYVPKTPADRLEVLRVEGLTYCYPATDQGVLDASFRLTRGSLTVITGEIGAGKTTLLRAILGLLPAQQGQLFWNEQVVADPGTFMVPPRCAYLPQVPRLLSETLAANILLGLSEAQVDVPGALHAAVLEADVQEMGQGLETLLGPRGVRLSGGQRQRVAAARMFGRDAELLVVDDLSSALDVETERLLWERLRARPETTCLAVSHRPAVLRRADQILLMEKGRITAQGPLDTLLANTPAMQARWETMRNT